MNVNEILSSIQAGHVPEIWAWTGYSSQNVMVVSHEELVRIVVEAKAFAPEYRGEKSFEYENECAEAENIAVILRGEWFYGRREHVEIYVTPEHWLAKYIPVRQWDDDGEEFWTLELANS